MNIKSKSYQYRILLQKEDKILLDRLFAIKRNCWNFCLAVCYDLDERYPQYRKPKYKKVKPENLVEEIRKINEANKFNGYKIANNVRFLNKPLQYKQWITRLYKYGYLRSDSYQDKNGSWVEINRDWQHLPNMRFFDLLMKDSFDKAWSKFWEAAKNGQLKRARAKYWEKIKVNGRKFNQRKYDMICKPKFKRWNEEQTFTSDFDKGGGSIDITTGLLSIHKSIKPIKLKIRADDKIFKDKVVRFNSFTLKRTTDGKYYCSLSFRYEFDVKQVKDIDSVVGIDVGCKNAIIMSNGDTFDYPAEQIERMQKQIENLQNKANRSYLLNKDNKDWSKKNQRKIYQKIGKIHRKITNIKNQHLHHITNAIVDTYDLIGLENFAIKNTTQQRKAKPDENGNFAKNGAAMKRGFNRKFLGNRPYMTKQMLKYKAEWQGKHTWEAPSKYPSSKNCCCCGHKNKRLTINDRSWTCDKCLTWHDRDFNASINLALEALHNKMLEGVNTPTIKNAFVRLGGGNHLELEFKLSVNDKNLTNKDRRFFVSKSSYEQYYKILNIRLLSVAV